MTHIAAADQYMLGLGLGDEVYRVGGSVRDELMGRKPHDADYIVRGKTFDAIGRVLPKGKRPLKLRTGEIVGWETTVRDIGTLQIAMPRAEFSTGYGRHEFDIKCSPEIPLDLDAMRRDFTVNALYLRLKDRHIIDPLDGQYHLNGRLLKTTHPMSFQEDPLRMLRAMRFVATLGMVPTSSLRQEMRVHSDTMTGLTKKGVSGTAWDELSKLLMGARPDQGLRLGVETRALVVLLPELRRIVNHPSKSPYHDLTTDEHTFSALRAAAGLNLPLRVRVALLFHDTGKPEVEQDERPYYVGHEEASARLAREALTRLNVPKRLRDDVLVLIRRHMVGVSGRTRPAKVRTWRCELGDALLSDLFKHRLADIMGKGSIDYAAVEAITRLENIRAEAERDGVPTSPRGLAVNGQDAMAIGLEGQAIGEALRKLLHEVVSQPDKRHRDRDWQLERLRNLVR